MDPVITIIISICMFLLFAVAATHKLRAMAVFRAAMDDYQLIPQKVTGLVSILLVMAELLSAVAVLIPATRFAGYLTMTGLLLLYTTGISINLARGRRNIDCGCSGPASRHELSNGLVLRNLALLGLVILALAFPATSPAGDRLLNWLDILVIIFSVMVISGLYTGINQLLAQAPKLAALKAGT